MPTDPIAAPPTEQQALLDAIDSLLAPLSRLAVARGLTHATLQESLKRSLVLAAAAAHPQAAAHRSVSRISTTTGINRREVTRLVQPPNDRPGRSRSKASEVFAHWITVREYRDTDGTPRTLPRQGPQPSFETLAHAVTRDVHPRSLLDELVRLGLAEYNDDTDTVRLLRSGFVPTGDNARMLEFLADNVGDHLHAAVDNVLFGGRRHFEQAVFADGLSDASMAEIRTLIGPQWQLMLEALVPRLQTLADADTALPPTSQRRVRVGVYVFDDAGHPAADQQKTPAPPKRRRLKGRPETDA